MIFGPFILCLFLTSDLTSGAVKKLPSYLKKCSAKLSDEGMSQCIGEAFTDALRAMKGGEPSLGIPPIDPMFVPALTIEQSGNNPVTISIYHRNLSVFGSSACSMVKDSFSFDKKTGTLKGKTLCPELVLKGDYELKGRILLLPVNGQGKCTIVLEKPSNGIYAKGQIIRKNGLEYVNYTDIKYTTEPSKVRMQFDNLFPGDPTISKNVNDVMNENWKEIMKDMKPAYEAVFSKVFLSAVQNVFSRVPLKEILTDYEE